MVSEHSDDENTSTEAKDTNTANRKAGKTADAGRAVNASKTLPRLPITLRTIPAGANLPIKFSFSMFSPRRGSLPSICCCLFR